MHDSKMYGFFSIAKLIISKYLFQKRIQFELISNTRVNHYTRHSTHNREMARRRLECALQAGQTIAEGRLYLHLYTVSQYIVTKKVVVVFSTCMIAYSFFHKFSPNFIEGCTKVSILFCVCDTNVNKSRSEPGNAPRIGIGHREVVCQK